MKTILLNWPDSKPARRPAKTNPLGGLAGGPAAKKNPLQKPRRTMGKTCLGRMPAAIARHHRRLKAKTVTGTTPSGLSQQQSHPVIKCNLQFMEATFLKLHPSSATHSKQVSTAFEQV